jgi:hypothetical protein
MRLYYSQSPGRFGFFLSFNLPGNLSGIFKMRNSNLNDSVAKAKREDGGKMKTTDEKKKTFYLWPRCIKLITIPCFPVLQL